jgi:outer membrane lipoprotein-sorting protein
LLEPGYLRTNKRMSVRCLLSLLALGCGIAAAPCRADRVAEIAEIHRAALGGTDRIAALHAFRSTGELRIGSVTALLTVTAARPNKLRVETRYSDHVVVAVFNGSTAMQRTNDEPAQALGADAAYGLAEAADFDDPLVAPAEDGCVVEYAGETTVDGDAVFRLLVTRRLTKTYFLAVDQRTYFIVQRLDTSNGAAEMLTRYADYRPVAGVLMPHRVSVETPGQPARVAVFEHIEPNPVLGSDVFRLR